MSLNTPPTQTALYKMMKDHLDRKDAPALPERPFLFISEQNRSGALNVEYESAMMEDVMRHGLPWTRL